MDLSSLMSAMKQMLVVLQGNLNFGHQYLSNAVEKQYLILLSDIIFLHTKRYTPEMYYTAQTSLRDYWRNVPFDSKVAHEYPWLLARIMESPLCADVEGAQDTLAEVLLDLEKFRVFYIDDSLTYELLKYPLVTI